jgi:glutamate transport system substrate-binding protein
MGTVSRGTVSRGGRGRRIIGRRDIGWRDIGWRVRGLTAGATIVGTLALAAGCVQIEPAAMTSDFAVATGVHLDASPTFQHMQARGSIVIGVRDDQPYLGYQDPKTGGFSGFDIDIARLVAAGLGFGPSQIKFVAVPSTQREADIENGTVDIVVASYSITDARRKQVSFAGPYLRTGAALMVRDGNASITGIAGLPAGTTICTGSGSDTLNNVAISERISIRYEDNYSTCVNMLLTGQVDAVATDQTLLAGYAAEYPGRLKLTGPAYTTELYGVGLPLGDQALRGKIDDILERAEHDGTWQAIDQETLAQAGLKLTPPAILRY